MSYNKADLQHRMEASVAQLQKEYSGLRTGRASMNMLEPVMVDAYGSMMPLNQVGSVSVPEPRMLTVTVWDAGLTKNVEKAIRDSGLGLNPMAEGTVIRVPVPQLTEDRRKELAKVAAKYAEETRVAVRNIRRDGMDNLKKAQKDGDISEDEQKRHADDVQKLTDTYIKKIDDMLVAKEKDIMTV
jgi:ribosome recycling factor